MLRHYVQHLVRRDAVGVFCQSRSSDQPRRSPSPVTDCACLRVEAALYCLTPILIAPRVETIRCEAR
jgi:hypothetical protein